MGTFEPRGPRETKQLTTLTPSSRQVTFGVASDHAAPSPAMSMRERRRAALQATQGLWATRTDILGDGVQLQEQMRAEWQE